MIHELRTYTIQPPKFRDFVALAAKVGVKLRTVGPLMQVMESKILIPTEFSPLK